MIQTCFCLRIRNPLKEGGRQIHQALIPLLKSKHSSHNIAAIIGLEVGLGGLLQFRNSPLQERICGRRVIIGISKRSVAKVLDEESSELGGQLVAVTYARGDFGCIGETFLNRIILKQGVEHQIVDSIDGLSSFGCRSTQHEGSITETTVAKYSN